MAAAAVEIPPSNHGIPGSKMLQHVDLPDISSTKSEPTDPHAVVTSWLESFNRLIAGEAPGSQPLFLDASYWRDLLCTTWNFHTYHGASKIISVLDGTDQKCRLQVLHLDSSSDVKKPTVCPIDFNGNLQGVQAFLTLETTLGRGRGLVKLVQDANDRRKWKAFILFTVLEQLKGYEESINSRRPTGVDHGSHPGRLNWQERRNVEANCEGSFEPTVLIVGQFAQ
ncbi:MAG: hypothetical protein Q9168_004729 [Polycauliona sp. 1 TL-2023]